MPDGQNLKLKIVHRDRWLVAIDKPSGLHAQAPRGGGPNAYDALRVDYPQAALHHRLDTPASGLMLFAIHPAANQGLARQLQARQIRRRYRIYVLGDPGEQGTWRARVDGREATTRWRRVALGGGVAALDVSLETGRKHQIRLHASGAGHPVLGDRRYGGAAGRAWPRLALHARALHLEHPVTGARLSLVAPLPDDLTGLAERVGA